MSTTNLKETLIRSLTDILHSTLTTAINNCSKNYQQFDLMEIMPIVLAHFVYHELFVMSITAEANYNKSFKEIKNLFDAILHQVIEGNIQGSHNNDKKTLEETKEREILSS